MASQVYIVKSQDWDARAIAAFRTEREARELASQIAPQRIDEELDDWFDRVSRSIVHVPLMEVVEDAE